MSLYIHLEGPEEEVECKCRECGHVHTRKVKPERYERNITSNITKMADEAGVFDCLWQPAHHGWTKAKQLIPMLEEGLAELRRDPDYFIQFEPKSGWGRTEHLLNFVSEVLNVCREYPEADVSTSY